MAMTVHLDIVSVESQIFSGLVEVVIAHGETGELGIYPGHTPLLTTLKSDLVRIIKQGGEEEAFYISGGILEVQPKVITILADTLMRASDLDEEKALEAKERAQKILESKVTDLEYSQALAELAEATAQIQAIRRLRKKVSQG